MLLDHGLYTQLSNKFRYDYSDFWLAIINRDVEQIKAAADKLGVGELYGLFACMVTARCWMVDISDNCDYHYAFQIMELNSEGIRYCTKD